MMFVDSSVVVAIIGYEAERETFLETLFSAKALHTSPLCRYEIVTALTRLRKLSIAQVCADVDMFFANMSIQILPITFEDSNAALTAFETYGKGRGHPAQLNMGDCFSLAMAQRRGLRLIYKGNDFAALGL